MAIEIDSNSNLASYAAAFYRFVNAPKYGAAIPLHLTLLMWSKISLKLTPMNFLMPDNVHKKSSKSSLCIEQPNQIHLTKF